MNQRWSQNYLTLNLNSKTYVVIQAITIIQIKSIMLLHLLILLPTLIT